MDSRQALTSAVVISTAAVLGHLWRRAQVAEAEIEALKADSSPLPAMPVLPISSPRTLAMCRNLELRDGDVFVCSYPKSGTTWMQHIVTSLLTRGTRPAAGEHISAFAPFFEIDKSWDANTGQPRDGALGEEAAGGRRIFNTHLRWSQMPKQAGSGARYIYVLRDGCDVATSFFHHLSNQDGDGGFEGSFDDFFESWLAGSLPYGRWVDHVKSWLALRHSGNVGADHVHVVVYEDLLADPANELEKLNAFLGMPSLNPTELATLVEVTSFQFMKEHEDRFQPQSVAWKNGFHFIRKGAAGDHRALMTAKQVHKFHAQVQREFPRDVLKVRPSFLGLK